MKLTIATLTLLFFSFSTLAQTKTVREDKLRLEKVDAYVRAQMAENHIPGLSLAVVRDGKVILSKGYGMANLELSSPARENTVFTIYSITKPITAIAVMMLVEEGKLSVEDPLSKHFQGLPSAWGSVTIGHLLNHTSGIPEYCATPGDPCSRPGSYSPAETMKLLTAAPFYFAPGERWAYNNTGYFLLGMLIAKASGKAYAQFLQERIFTPLDMRNTRLDDHAEVIPERASGYTWQNDKYRNAVRISPTITYSAAGLISTVLDLAKLDAALNAGKLLKPATLERMWTKTTLNSGETVDNGLGFGMTPFKGHRRVGHSGGVSGFATTLSRLVDHNITVIILTNSDDKGHAGGKAFLINDIANEIGTFYL